MGEETGKHGEAQALEEGAAEAQSQPVGEKTEGGPHRVLRVGVLGVGSMGRHHVRNVRALEGMELAGIADPAGDRFGVAGTMPVLPDVKALIDVGIDAAIVAVPTVFHEDAANALAAAGVHTLIEKPLAAELDSAERIARMFESAGLVGAVGYVERCNPSMLELRKRLQAGQLGRVYQIATRRQSPFPSRIQDVGVVKDLATHDVDLAMWLSGARYETIFAQVAEQSGRQNEDMVVASGRLTNGVLVNHVVNWLSPFKDRTTVVTGERGALVADTTISDLTFYENGKFPVQWDQIAAFRGVSEGTVTRYAMVKREPIAVELEHFRDAIWGVGNEHVTMREGVETLKVVQAILTSASLGQAVRPGQVMHPEHS